MSWPELQQPTIIAFLFCPWDGMAPENCEEWTSRVPLNEEIPLMCDGKLGSPL